MKRTVVHGEVVAARHAARKTLPRRLRHRRKVLDGERERGVLLAVRRQPPHERRGHARGRRARAVLMQEPPLEGPQPRVVVGLQARGEPRQVRRGLVAGEPAGAHQRTPAVRALVAVRARAVALQRQKRNMSSSEALADLQIEKF